MRDAMSSPESKEDFVGEIPIDQPLTEELELAQDLGTDVEEKGFYARVGDKPTGCLVRDFFKAASQPVPPNFDVYSAYELWVVPHRVAIIRRSGRAEVTSVGIEVEYIPDGKTCCVIALLPEHRFVDVGSLSFKVKIGADGSAQSGTDTLSGPAVGDPNVNRAGLSINACAGGEAGLLFSAAVAAPEIQAVGIGSSRCEWRFDLDSKFQYGQDIQCWSMVMLPRRRGKSGLTISYRIRFYLVMRTLFLSTRRQSDWQNLECVLSGNP